MLGLLAGCHVTCILLYEQSNSIIALGHTTPCLLQVLAVWMAYA